MYIEPIQSVVFKLGLYTVSANQNILNLYRVLYLNKFYQERNQHKGTIEPIQSVVFKLLLVCAKNNHHKH